MTEIWLASGLMAWVLFGLAGRTRRFSPFECPEFYIAVLPVSLIMPPGIFIAALITWVRNDEI